MQQYSRMKYRVCKSFTVENGHMLSKHPSRCRYPHGHTRHVEIVLAASGLDGNDMVCDFKAVKLAIGDFLDRFDHALAINSDDPLRDSAEVLSKRLLVFEGEDPTTEVMARHIFEFLRDELGSGRTYHDDEGNSYGFHGVEVERVRVGETPSSWAEYGVA